MENLPDQRSERAPPHHRMSYPTKDLAGDTMVHDKYRKQTNAAGKRHN